MIDIVKFSYCLVMKKKTSFNKMELWKRYLRMRYNVHMSDNAIKERDKAWKKESDPC